MTQNNVLTLENADAVTLLFNQGTFVTQGTGEPVPGDPSRLHDILDLGCGPGEWVLSLAQRYPHMHVMGIDINEEYVAYARSQAEAAQLRNATFQRVSAIQLPSGNNIPSLDAIPDATFDLINGRFFGTFLSKKLWVEVIQQCYRLLRPGGALQLTDHALACTNSPAFDQWLELIYTSQIKAGQKVSKSESVLIMLYSLLEAEGFQVVAQQPHAIDISFGRETHHTMSSILMYEVASTQPLLVRKMNLIAEEDYEDLKKRLLEDFRSPEFKGIWFLLTVIGRKPQSL